jgi:hypothetical protein
MEHPEAEEPGGAQRHSDEEDLNLTVAARGGDQECIRREYHGDLRRHARVGAGVEEVTQRRFVDHM